MNMLKIDGDIDPVEIQYMEELIEQANLTTDQKSILYSNLKNLDFEKIDVSEFKENEAYRIAFVEAMYNMAKIDKIIKPSEKIYFYKVARELGFEKEELKDIFDDI